MSEIAPNVSSRNHLQYIRGIPFTNAPRFPRKNIEEAFDYIARDSEIVIASYLKTGTTLLEYVILQIMSKGEWFPNMNELNSQIIPYVEITGTSVLKAQEGLKAHKHHLPFNMIQKNEKAKYFYIYRRPEDTLVSNYYFAQDVRNEKIEMDDFFEDFLAGKHPSGSYFSHVSSYISHINDDNVFITTFEKLMLNRRNEILRISEFLGDNYYRNVKEESVMKAIIENTSFDYMKSNLGPINNPDYVVLSCKSSEINFFRKGEVGDGQNLLSQEQMHRLRNAMDQQIEDKQFCEWWD